MRDIRRPLIIAFIAVGTVVPGTQLAAASQELAPAGPRAEGQLHETASTALSAYVLGPDDQIRIQVADVPDISDKPQRLDPDGDLRLPMVGRVHAAGMTLGQLEAELKTRLKVYIQEPDVAVSVAEFRSQPVSVIGAVKASGVHQLEGRKTLIEVLSLAGGVDNAAGPTARITRRPEFGRIPLPDAATDSAGDFSIVEIDLKALLEAKTPERNIVIRPHDVISIPRAEVVYVIGEVERRRSAAERKSIDLRNRSRVSLRRHPENRSAQAGPGASARRWQRAPHRIACRSPGHHGRQSGRPAAHRRRHPGGARQQRQALHHPCYRGGDPGRHSDRHLTGLSAKQAP